MVLFSAVLHRERVTVAQLRVPAGTTETTQVTALLDPVDLRAVVVTADAAHTCRATAAYVVEQRHADYVLTVKGNQAALLARVHAALPPAVPEAEEHVQTERSHGRIVRRSAWTAPVPAGLDFPGAARVFRVRRDVFDLDGQRVSKEIVHGVTSLTERRCTPADLAGHVRRHWGVEVVHHIRDVTFKEDAQQAYTGTGAQVMATFRNLAIGLLKLAGHTNIKRATEHIAADRMRILDVLSSPAT